MFNIGDQTSVDLIIDTATDFIAVDARGYDIDARVSSSSATVNNFQSEIDFGDNYWVGKWGQDKFCVRIGQCYDTDIFLIQERAGNFTEGADGIVGLAKGDFPFAAAPNERPRNEYFYLKEMNLTAPQFATRFRKGKSSSIDFGAEIGSDANMPPFVTKSFKDYFWSGQS